MTVGENIKKYRKIKRLTQKELGEKIGRTQRTIQAYEKGEVTPPLTIIENLANILGVEESDLISGDSLDEKMNTGELIKKYRKEKKITQKQLAALIGKAEITIRKYESGALVPPLEILYSISKVLEIPVENLATKLFEEKTCDSFSDEELIQELKLRGYQIIKIY